MLIVNTLVCSSDVGLYCIFSIQVRETDSETSTSPFSFTVAADSRCLVLVANSQEEKDKWLEDLKMARIRSETEDKETSKMLYPTLKSNSYDCISFNIGSGILGTYN